MMNTIQITIPYHKLNKVWRKLHHPIIQCPTPAGLGISRHIIIAHNPRFFQLILTIYCLKIGSCSEELDDIYLIYQP